MGKHIEEFLLSVLSIAIADWTSKVKTFSKSKNRTTGPFIDEIYDFCKNHVKSSYDFIESELDETENNHSPNDLNNKQKIAGLFSEPYLKIIFAILYYCLCHFSEIIKSHPQKKDREILPVFLHQKRTDS